MGFRLQLGLHSKTTLILLFSFFALILLFSGYVYVSVKSYSYEDFDKLLDIRLLTAARAELNSKRRPDAQELQERFFERLPHERDYFFEIKQGKTYSDESRELGVPESFFQEVLTNGAATYKKNEYLFKGIRYMGDSGEYIAIASAANYFETHHTEYLKRTLLIAILVAFVFSVIISVYYSRSVFKPLRTITNQVRRISSESLHLRLEASQGNEELRELTSTFNYMLDRIETSFETQNNFISNASHELRTPLTAIIGEADVALNKLRTPEEYIETIKVILEEAESLERKTAALLYLAQTGFDGKTQLMSKVRVDQLLWDVKETLQRINSKYKINLDMSLLPDNPVKLKVLGNEQLLHLALSNIISNACKYSDFKQVEVSLGATENYVVMVVRDYGIGIPIEELKYIYDPFFRASNTSKFEGFGIGLPLARNILRMHNAKLEVKSIVEKGTTVQISLPIGKFETG